MKNYTFNKLKNLKKLPKTVFNIFDGLVTQIDNKSVGWIEINIHDDMIYLGFTYKETPYIRFYDIESLEFLFEVPSDKIAVIK